MIFIYYNDLTLATTEVMQCSKVFGYTLFSEYLIENSPLPNYKESGRRARGVTDMGKKTYCVFATILQPEEPKIMFSYSQTCYFKHSYLSLLANQTGEAYRKCTLHHLGCKLTRFEHFLRDLQQTVFQPDSTPSKDTCPKDLDWVTEHLIQRFYNDVLTFNEFLDVLLKIADFPNVDSVPAQRLCWEVYHREYHSVFQKLALVNEHSAEFIEHLFGIFNHLDRHISCQISPFLMKQFIIWWIKESETNPDKHFQLIESWYESSDGKVAIIDFIEFVDLLYKLFFKHFPVTTRHYLLKDAYHSLVCKVLKKGYLAKCGPNNSKYLVRWIILYPDKLEYYKRRTEEDMTKRGTILLGDKAVVKNVYDDDKKGFYKFTVSFTSTTRQFSIRADDIRIRMAWVTAIDHAIDVLRGKKGLQVFEKPLDLSTAEYDILRSSSFHSNSGSKDREPHPPLLPSSSVPLPAPYNGALSDNPSDPLFLGEDPLTSQQHFRNQIHTLDIKHIDRDLPDNSLVNSLYMSGSIALNSTYDNDDSTSSSEDENSVPPLPDRSVNRRSSSQDVINHPVPAPRTATKQSSQHRISMNTHGSFENYHTLKIIEANLPKATKRYSYSYDCPKRPPRNIPSVPKRVESLTKGRYKF